jgi:thiamine transport system substrate-binding protein
MRRVVLAVVVALVLAACSSSAKPSASGSSGPAATPAQKIGTVVLLTHSSFATSKGVLADFTKQTGYKVKIVQPGDAGVLVNEAILRKDNPVGDLLYGVDNTFLSRALNAGIFDPPGQATAIDTADVCVVYDKTYFGHGNHPVPPTSLDDLTRPAYKNLLVTENASTSSPGLAFLLATIGAKGDPGWQDYWKALKANGVRVVDDWTQAYQSDFTAGGGSGDRPIVVSYGSDPVADVVFSDPHHDTPNVGVIPSTCFRQTEYAAVLHNAHNVPGAQALLQFLQSPRFQGDMPLQMYVTPENLRAAVPPVFAKWVVAPDHPLSMDASTIGAHRDAWIKEWNDLVVQ